jgi:uncharacterized protein YpbB
MQQHHPEPVASSKPSKKDKVPTAEVSYRMFREGKDIMEIALARGLVPGTIQAHLCQYVETGQIDVLQVLDQHKLQDIMNAYQKGAVGAGQLKSALGHDFSYGEIRLALAHARAGEQSN